MRTGPIKTYLNFVKVTQIMTPSCYIFSRRKFNISRISKDKILKYSEQNEKSGYVYGYNWKNYQNKKTIIVNQDERDIVPQV